MVRALSGHLRRLAAGVLAALIVVLALAVVDLQQVSAVQPRSRATAGGDRSRRALLSVLGVLRSPVTPGDRSPVLLARLGGIAATLQDPGPERLDSSLVRVAGRTPWGSEVVLAGFVTTGQARPGAVPERAGALVGSTFGVRGPATAIRARGLPAFEQIGPREVRVVVVVPDGVDRIRYMVGRAASVSAQVRDNVAAFVIRPVPRLAPGLIAVEASMIWYGRNGRVLRSVPSMLASKHIRSA